MPIKCESCRHRKESDLGLLGTAIRCSNRIVMFDAYGIDRSGDMPLAYAREICDREGDGHFVYFEPKEPTAGAAFVGESRAEFERDRMGQTGENNAAAMKAAA